MPDIIDSVSQQDKLGEYVVENAEYSVGEAKYSVCCKTPRLSDTNETRPNLKVGETVNVIDIIRTPAFLLGMMGADEKVEYWAKIDESWVPFKIGKTVVLRPTEETEHQVFPAEKLVADGVALDKSIQEDEILKNQPTPHR